MRGSKAKKLRQLAKMADMPAVNYSHQQYKHKLVATGMTNPNGTPHYTKVQAFTTKLGECQRGVYQDLKRMF